MKLGRHPKASAVSVEGEGGGLGSFWRADLVEQDFHGAASIVQGQHNRFVAFPTCLRPGIQLDNGEADSLTKDLRQKHAGFSF